MAGTSMFTMKNLHTHEGDMGMGHLWLNGLGIYDLMLVIRGVPFLIIAVSVLSNSQPVAYYREGGTTPHLRLVFI